jgi:hypothetical protein
MSKRRRIILGVGVAIVACCGYLWFLGIQTLYVIQARRLARTAPIVMLTLTEPPDLSISQAPGQKLAYFGYEFEVPWSDIDLPKTKIRELNKLAEAAVITFRSGNVIAFWSESKGQIGYDLMRAILEATPDKASLLASKQRAVQQTSLLTLKATIVPRSAESGIYSLRTKELQGFQYGRPQNPPKPLSIELFPSNGRLHIFFGQKPNGPTIITQADVNRIIQSLHKVQADAN